MVLNKDRRAISKDDLDTPCVEDNALRLCFEPYLLDPPASIVAASRLPLAHRTQISTQIYQ